MKRYLTSLVILALGITLNAQTVLFSETFSNCNGSGGNDDNWSGKIASSTFYSSTEYQEDNTTVKNQCSADNEGWILEYGNAANGCIKLGTGSAIGSAQTPVLSNLTSDEAVLTFRAGAWNSTNEAIRLNISISGDGATLSQSQVELNKGHFDIYTIKINGASNESRITFSANVKTNNRFFLDDIIIKSVEGGEEEEEDTYPQKTIQEAKELQENTEIELVLNNAFVTYVNGSDVFITDANGSILLNGLDFESEVEVGDIITSNIIANYTNDNGLHKITKSTHTKPIKTTNIATVIAVKVDIAEIIANTSYTESYIELCGYIKSDEDNTYLVDELATDASDGILLDKRYSDDIEFVDSEDGDEKQTVKGLYVIENTVSKLLATEYIAPEKPEIEEVNPPVFVTAGGLYETQVDVTISADENTVVYYTTDNSEPTTESSIYSSPLSLDATTTVKSFAVSSSGTKSEISEAIYYIVSQNDEDLIDFSQCGYENAEAITSTSGISEIVFFNYTKGTKPAYYTTGKAVRLYSSCSLTIKSLWNIIAVEMSYAGSYSANKENTSVSEGTNYDYETHRWDIGAKEATLNYIAASGQIRITNMKFIYAVEAPSFDIEGGVVKRGTRVSITSGNNDIYYTLDGTEPTAGSSKYSEPIVVNETMTIKAIAFDSNGNASKVASETYVTYNYTTISDAKELEDGSIINLNFKNAVVNKITNDGVYVTDVTGSIFINLPELAKKVTIGSIINGTMEIEYVIDNGRHSVVSSENTNITDLTITEGSAPVASDVDFSDIYDSDITEGYVKLTAFVKKQEDGTYYLVEDIEDDITYGIVIDNHFNIDLDIIADESAKVTGIILSNGGQYYILPLTMQQEATSIRLVNTNKDDNSYYNLLGQKVGKNYRGIVVSKGKKRINR